MRAPWAENTAAVARTDGSAIAPNHIHVREPFISGWVVRSQTYMTTVATPIPTPRTDSLRHPRVLCP